MTEEDLNKLVKSMNEEPLEIHYTSLLDKLISNIYINEWIESYVSNMKTWKLL